MTEEGAWKFLCTKKASGVVIQPQLMGEIKVLGILKLPATHKYNFLARTLLTRIMYLHLFW